MLNETFKAFWSPNVKLISVTTGRERTPEELNATRLLQTTKLLLAAENRIVEGATIKFNPNGSWFIDFTSPLIVNNVVRLIAFSTTTGDLAARVGLVDAGELQELKKQERPAYEVDVLPIFHTAIDNAHDAIKVMKPHLPIREEQTAQARTVR